jgi:hypothetical protein
VPKSESVYTSAESTNNIAQIKIILKKRRSETRDMSLQIFPSKPNLSMERGRKFKIHLLPNLVEPPPKLEKSPIVETYR